MGLVPKRHSDKWRLVVDLSSPRGRSVNDGISPALCSLQYASIDNAVDLIMYLGRSTELVKLDLSNAYRIVPVHPDDQPLLGISWQGNTYLDRSLPFGLKSAPKILTAVADLLTWVLYCEGISFVLHYSDNFLVLGPPGSIMAATMRSGVESILAHVGAPLAHHKIEGPTTALIFLGIRMDTNLFQLSLPEEKLSRLQDILCQWKRRKCCTKKELESLIGHLSHAATVIRPGRIFLRNLFALLSRLTIHACLNLDVRTDIAWWQCLLQHWNGRSFFPLPSPSCHLYSDASGSFGCGAHSIELDSWFQLLWPHTWNDIEIAAKELVPTVLAAAIGGPRWSGSHVCFHCDNDAVVTISKTGEHSMPSLLSYFDVCSSTPLFIISIFLLHTSLAYITHDFLDWLQNCALSRGRMIPL